MIKRFFSSTVNISVGVNNNWFVSVWKTDNAGISTSTQVQLPITLGTSPNLEVDWGDGNIDYNTTLHTYSTAGIYEIKIKQHGYSDFRFNNGGDKLKLLEVKQWGGIWFSATTDGNIWGCSDMTSTATDLPNVSHKTNFYQFFRNCRLFNQPLDGLDVSNGTNFSRFLMECVVFNQPVENLAVQNGTNPKIRDSS